MDLRRELGLGDLALTQILFVVGLPWVGVAAKQGPSHVVFWLIAMVLFYLPSAIVVIHLNRLMPLEGGLYQWAKLGFNDMTGFLVAWNLWLFAILNTSETGLQITQYAAYVGGRGVEGLASDTRVILFASAAIFSALVWLAIRGLSFGKWVHASGGVLLLATFAMLLIVPWLNVAKGTLPSFHPLATAAPVVSLMSLNLLGKMGFGAFGGFEYVAIHAGECRNPVRTIGRSVMIAAPIIAIMFILGFFLDTFEIILIMLPICGPPLILLGLDPLWIGVMVAMNLQTSFMTPPFGFTLFYLRGVAPSKVGTSQIWAGALPFVVLQLMGLILLWTFPGTATWLPKKLFGPAAIEQSAPAGTSTGGFGEFIQDDGFQLDDEGMPVEVDDPFSKQ